MFLITVAPWPASPVDIAPERATRTIATQNRIVSLFNLCIVSTFLNAKFSNIVTQDILAYLVEGVWPLHFSFFPWRGRIVKAIAPNSYH